MHKPPNRNTIGPARGRATNALAGNQKTKLKKPNDSNSQKKPQLDQQRIDLQVLHNHSLSESAKSSVSMRTKTSLSRQPLTSKRPSILLEAEGTHDNSKSSNRQSILDIDDLSDDSDPYGDTSLDILMSTLPEEEIHFSLSSSDSSPVSSPVVRKRTPSNSSRKASKRLKTNTSATQATSFIDLSPSPAASPVLGTLPRKSPSKNSRPRPTLFMSSPDGKSAAATSATPQLTPQFRRIPTCCLLTTDLLALRLLSHL